MESENNKTSHSKKKANSFSNRSKFIFTFCAIIMLGFGVIATTIISDDSVTTPEVNGVLYVSSGTPSDIQTKIDLANTNGGGTVKLPSGSLDIAGIAPIILKSNVILDGSIFGTTIYNSNGDSNFFEADTNAGNIELRNFNIDGNNDNYKGILFANGNNDNITIENIKIENLRKRAIVIDGNNALIQFNTLLNVSDGIGIGDSINDRISRIYNNEISSLQNLTSLTEYGEGIEVNVHSSLNSISYIENNIISGFEEDGIDCNALDCKIYGNEITGVSYSDRSSSLIVVHRSDGDNIAIVSGNTLKNITDKGVSTLNVKNIKITNNNLACSENELSDCIGVSLGSNVDLDFFTNYSTVSLNTFENMYTSVLNYNRDSIPIIKLMLNEHINVTTQYVNFYNSASASLNNLVNLDNYDIFKNEKRNNDIVIDLSYIDNSSSYILDSSIYGNDFEQLSGVTIEDGEYTVDGISGSGARTNTDFMSNATELTYYTRFKLDSFGADQTLMSMSDSDTYPQLKLYYRSDGYMRLRFRNASSIISEPTFQFVDDNDWHTTAIVFKGGESIKYYFDGQLMRTDSTTQDKIITTGADYFGIGKNGDLSDEVLNGSMSHTMVFLKELSNEDIRLLDQFSYSDIQQSYLSRLNGGIVYGNITVDTLSGTGNDYACLDSTGKLYRSAAACS